MVHGGSLIALLLKTRGIQNVLKKIFSRVHCEYFINTSLHDNNMDTLEHVFELKRLQRKGLLKDFDNKINSFQSAQLKHDRLLIEEKFTSEDLKPESPNASLNIEVNVDYESSLPKITVTHVCKSIDYAPINWDLAKIGKAWDEDDIVQCEYQVDSMGNEIDWIKCSKSTYFIPADDFKDTISKLSIDIEEKTNLKDQCF